MLNPYQDIHLDDDHLSDIVPREVLSDIAPHLGSIYSLSQLEAIDTNEIDAPDDDLDIKDFIEGF